MTNISFQAEGFCDFPRLKTPEGVNGSEPKYSLKLIIPKRDKAAIDALQAAINQAADRKWPKIPDGFQSPLRDGDVERAGRPGYEDSYFMTLSSKFAPAVFGCDAKPTDPDVFYSGCRVRVKGALRAYDSYGRKSISVYLDGVQFIGDGDRLYSRSQNASMFTPVESDEGKQDDDDLLS